MSDIRLAGRADAMEIARLHVRSWQRAYRGFFPDDYLDALRPEERAARYTFADSPSDGPVTIVAVEDGAIRGFATIGAARDVAEGGTGEVLGLYVDPDHWRRGVGGRLMSEARGMLRKFGFELAILWVLAGNERAERFYRADGWAPDGERRRNQHWGVATEELRYVRRLD